MLFLVDLEASFCSINFLPKGFLCVMLTIYSEDEFRVMAGAVLLLSLLLQASNQFYHANHAYPERRLIWSRKEPTALT